jgi:ribosome-binding protein aMBF1 (putative translation factor)
MSESAKLMRIERTPEQKAEERRIREMHRQNPIREVPADTMSGADAAQMLRFVATLQRDREVLGLSVEETAKRACVDPVVLSKLESGLSFNPSAATLFRIARALGKKLVLAIDDANP